MGIEEWVIQKLRLLEPYVPGVCKVFLKRFARALLGWLLVLPEFLRYAYSQLHCSFRAVPRSPGLTVVIVEPSLGSRASIGHEMPFSLTVATSLIEQGIDVHVFGHHRLSPAVATAFARRRIPCRRVFKQSGVGTMPIVDADARIGMLGRFLAQAFAFAADLTWGLARSRAGSPRLLFFPTSGLSCMVASSPLRWRTSRAEPAESHVHVLHLPAQLGGRGSYASWFRRLLRVSFGVHIGTVNPQLNTELRALGEAEAIGIPIPRPVDMRPWSASPIAPRRIGFLGHANEYKGFMRLPALLSRLLEGPASFRIVVQTNPYLPTRALSEATDTLRRLARQSDRIELVEDPLAMDEYYELLSGVDVVVLPYDADAYGSRISSVAIEAMASGKVIVGPEVGWFAEQQHIYGGYLAVDTADDEQLARRVLEAVEHFDTLTQQAARDAVKFDWHNVQSLVTLLMELAERDGTCRAS